MRGKNKKNEKVNKVEKAVKKLQGTTNVNVKLGKINIKIKSSLIKIDFLYVVK